MFANFQELMNLVKPLKPLRISVAGGESESALESVRMAREAGLGEAVLVGNREKIAPLLEKAGLSGDIPLIHQENPGETGLKAAELVRTGEADVLLKGQINTKDFIRGILDRERGLRTDNLLSSFSFFGIPGRDRMLCLTDGGINLAPTLEEKERILHNGLALLHTLENENPNVAVLSANEKVHPKLQSSVDAQALRERWEDGAFPGCVLEGPMAMDVILKEEAARKKGITSAIAGKVDLILVPTIDVGNGVGKTMIHFGGAEMAGMVLGAAAPALITSRSESAESKLYSLALSALYLHRKKG